MCLMVLQQLLTHISMTSKSRFVRSDPSMLAIAVSEEELYYRARTHFMKNEKKFLAEEIHCTVCNKHMKKVFSKGEVSFHPSLEVIICKDCEKFYASREFSVNENGWDEYCRWCGQGGRLYCCSSCSVAICKKCIKINFFVLFRRECVKDNWLCFICNPLPIYPHRLKAAVIKEYTAKHKSDIKHKRHYSDDSSDDSDGSSPLKVKRAIKDSSPGASKIIVDSSDKSDIDSGARSAAACLSVSSESYELVDRDSVRLFQHLLNDSLKDIDKLLKISVDSINSFRDKYINEKKYLQNFHDLGVAEDKYFVFLGNLVSSIKRIDATFFSSIQPLARSARSKRAVARTASSLSPTRESTDASKLSNEVVNKSSVEGAKKSNLEDKVENKSSSKIEVDDDDADVSATKSQNTNTGLTDVEEISSPAHRKSTSSNQEDADDENDASSSSERKEDSRENGRKKLSPDASMTNSVEISSKMEGNNDDETRISDTGASDSMIVNLGTEDKSVVSEKDSKAESSKEKSDDDLPEESDNEKSGQSEREKKSLVSGNNCNSLDVSDIDGGGSNSSTMNDKSDEGFATKF